MKRQKILYSGKSKSRDHAKISRTELDVFKNENCDIDYLVPFVCNEFTTLCPITGQPDFSRFEIVYVPDKNCLESKSLKLYLFSFRNKGNFHEDANKIFRDIWRKVNPKYMRIWADFTVRGGISIKPMIMKFGLSIKTEERKEIEKLVENYDRKAYFDRI